MLCTVPPQFTARNCDPNLLDVAAREANVFELMVRKPGKFTASDPVQIPGCQCRRCIFGDIHQFEYGDRSERDLIGGCSYKHLSNSGSMRTATLSVRVDREL
jgi:hypothetical protein